MLEYTKDSYFSFGYGNSQFNFADGRVEPFWLKFNRAQRTPESPFYEAIDCAKSIAAKGLPVLLVSGGLDSEMMLQIFSAARLEFRAVHFRYNNDLNSHESFSIEEISRKLGLGIEIIDFDAVEFLRSGEVLEYAEAGACSSPQFCTYLKMIELTSKFGIPVQASMFPKLITQEYYPKFIRKLDHYKFSGMPHYGHVWLSNQEFPCYRSNTDAEYATYRFLINKGIQAVPHFFFYSAELLLSFLLHSSTKEYCLQQNGFGELSRYAQKVRLYEDYFGLKAIGQRRKKYTGFENLKKVTEELDKNTYDETYRAPLLEKYPNSMINYYLPLSKMIEMLSSESDSKKNLAQIP